MPEIKLGDVVALKNGDGVNMVAGAFVNDGAGVTCYWHSEDGSPCFLNFPIVTLEVIDMEEDTTP